MTAGTKKGILTLLITALTLVAFAGCISDPAPAPEEDADRQGDGSEADTDLEEASGPNNTTEPPSDNATGSIPDAGIDVTIHQETAPANVTFDLSGSDRDGDALAWTLDWDGDGTVDENGTVLPASVNVTYETAGNYTARLVVTDKDGSANATVDLQILDGASDGMCHRPDALSVGDLYVDNRQLEPPEYSIWVYLESNGVPGLQVGGADEEDWAQNCTNPDTLIF